MLTTSENSELSESMQRRLPEGFPKHGPLENLYTGTCGGVAAPGVRCISLRLAALGRTKHCHHCRQHRRTLGTALTPDLEALKRPPCSLLERIRFRRTAVSKHVHEKKSYNCSSKNCSNILHVQTQNCWQKFSHVLRDCHVKLSSQEIKAYHTGVRRDYLWSEFRMYSWTVYSLLGFVLPCFCDSA